MALPNSGLISLADLAGEFGGSAPHYLSEYYGASTGVPNSGPIWLSQFHGKARVERYTVSIGTKVDGFGRSDGWELLGMGNVAPSANWKNYVMLGIVRSRWDNILFFVIDGIRPRNFISHISTQDGWNLYANTSNIFEHLNGNVTRWGWNTPIGGWDGTVAGRTRWIDIHP